jgi:RNA polymerase sigma-70 factor (ECF subfamily)
MTNKQTNELVSISHDTYAEPLRRYLLSKEKNLGLIEDIVQDSFLKLQIELQKGKKISNTKAWLYKVAYNNLMDHYRQHKTLPSNHLVESSEEIKHNSDHRPEDCLRGIIANLPYKYKKAVYLVDIKGIKQTDAAKEMNLALPTFKSHVQRGRNLVKQGYIDCCDYSLNEQGHLVGEIKDKESCKVCT